jgi:tRNA pseudouridine55 synthase
MHEERRGDGIVLVPKPAGITSHDMVDRIRRAPVSGGRKVGHAGTLDPFATGLLIMLIGRATRAQRYFMALKKTYRTRARFGVTSDTGDPTGALTYTGERATSDDLRATLPLLTGDIRQQVPLTSAVKVGGERLYRKARRGEDFESPVRTVYISRLELLAFDESEQTGELELECSSGTYVRQLVTDLGRLTGKGAYCEALERSAIGPFKLEDVDERRFIPLAHALDFLPERRLASDEARVARHGIGVALAEYGEETSGTVVRLTFEGELIALAERRGDVLKPVTVFSS